MKKVLFVGAVNPYRFSDLRYPPLWPAFLCAYAEQHLPPGSVSFQWCAGPIGSLLNRHRPDLLAISSVTQNFGFAEQYAREAKRRGIHVIVGGMHISSLPQSLIPEMDAAVMGEGEQTFTELLQLYLATGRLAPSELRNVPGVAFGDGIRSGPRISFPCIDDLPHPRRSLLGYRYRAYVHTSRGCIYHCVFCAAARFWGQVRYASPGYVMEELDELVSHGTRVVRFADDDFVASVPRVREIAELVQRRGYHKRLRFSCWCRANHVTPEVVQALRAMNVVSVKLGLESGSQRVLNYLKGDVSLEQNRSAVALLKDAGMQVNADFLFGVPDETEADARLTYEFIRRSPIDFFDVDIFSPLPNTPVWEMARRRGLVADRGMDWSRVSYKFITDEHRAIHLSERMTHAQLKRLHMRFQRLRALRTLRAALVTPWLNEIPGVVVRAGWLGLRRRMRRAFGLAVEDATSPHLEQL